MNEKKCNNCCFFIKYYIKGNGCFVKINRGFCSKQHKESGHKEICEFWQHNEKRLLRQNEQCLVALEDALKSIQEIAQILRENKGVE